MELPSSFGGPAKLFCELHVQWHNDVCPICALFALHRETQQLVRAQQSQIADLVADQLSLRRQVNQQRGLAQSVQDTIGALSAHIPLDEDLLP